MKYLEESELQEGHTYLCKTYDDETVKAVYKGYRRFEDDNYEYNLEGDIRYVLKDLDHAALVAEFELLCKEFHEKLKDKLNNVVLENAKKEYLIIIMGKEGHWFDPGEYEALKQQWFDNYALKFLKYFSENSLT